MITLIKWALVIACVCMTAHFVLVLQEIYHNVKDRK